MQEAYKKCEADFEQVARSRHHEGNDSIVNAARKAGIRPFFVKSAVGHYFRYGAPPIWEMRMFEE